MTDTIRYPCTMQCMESYTEKCVCACAGENHGYLLRLGAEIWQAGHEDRRHRARLATRYQDVCLRVSRVVSRNSPAEEEIS
jgi:hypothetical protein